ncbi:hypothetical protein D3C73_1167670 [compost metagenome]
MGFRPRTDIGEHKLQIRILHSAADQGQIGQQRLIKAFPWPPDRFIGCWFFYCPRLPALSINIQRTGIAVQEKDRFAAYHGANQFIQLRRSHNVADVDHPGTDRFHKLSRIASILI